jgi:hypothetical protein
MSDTPSQRHALSDKVSNVNANNDVPANVTPTEHSTFEEDAAGQSAILAEKTDEAAVASAINEDGATTPSTQRRSAGMGDRASLHVQDPEKQAPQAAVPELDVEHVAGKFMARKFVDTTFWKLTFNLPNCGSQLIPCLLSVQSKTILVNGQERAKTELSSSYA